MKMEERQIKETKKEIVIARLIAMPQNRKLAIGGYDKAFTIAELIEHVKKEDEIGKTVIEIHMAFLKRLKEGNFE